jgi:hypothetical protein
VIYQFHNVHVFWLVAAVYKNEFLLMCDGCGRGIAANPAEKRQVFRELEGVLALSLGPLHLLFGQTGFLLVLVPAYDTRRCFLGTAAGNWHDTPRKRRSRPDGVKSA